MTYERREEILSKDALNTDDIAELLDVSRGKANVILNNIKRFSDRLGIKGKIHVQDYIDYFRLGRSDRYGKRLTDDDTDCGFTTDKKDTTKYHFYSVMDPRYKGEDDK